ncbi:Alpha/beta hydrolase fold-1 [Mycena alexandri]|uniref:Alpha/beta hydrolase fold-1 n=1 Tax=Mycena alexandri TaxID=1745969 RepID=A0AAD6S5Q1_9AGAR|nr:Alpha/beta hydrolase fold-1 [Mycena alexandri]
MRIGSPFPSPSAIPTLTSQSYVFDPRPNFPLLLTAKRYWDSSSWHVDDPDAVTLVFARGTGLHKETYELTLEDLYTLPDNNTRGPNPKIRDAWAIDCPNHGDAAILNEAMLRWGYEPIFGWQEYARGIHAFLSGLGTGVDVDFSKRRLVFVGHSFSAVALVLTLTYQPPVKPEQLILVEIMCIRANAVPKMMQFVTEGSQNRRDIWPSRKNAYQAFKARQPWKSWDDRVLQKYVVRTLHSANVLLHNPGMDRLLLGTRSYGPPHTGHPDKEGVTLKCTRQQETAVYRDPLASAVVYRMMGSIVKLVQTHVIYGSLADSLVGPGFADEDDFVGNSVGGEQVLASLTRIPNAGHLAVQTHPREFAQIIFDILAKGNSPQARL